MCVATELSVLCATHTRRKGLPQTCNQKAISAILYITWPLKKHTTFPENADLTP